MRYGTHRMRPSTGIYKKVSVVPLHPFYKKTSTFSFKDLRKTLSKKYVHRATYATRQHKIRKSFSNKQHSLGYRAKKHIQFLKNAIGDTDCIWCIGRDWYIGVFREKKINKVWIIYSNNTVVGREMTNTQRKRAAGQPQHHCFIKSWAKSLKTTRLRLIHRDKWI